MEWHDKIDWQLPSPVGEQVMSWVEQTHSAEHIQRIKQVAEKGGGYLDGDTRISARSYEVALLAVSAWLDGVDRVLAGQTAFVLARPPGHHATKDTAMGFCLFSNAAIAANYALSKPNIKRVGILDWDVHHGNGTEAIVWDNPQIAYCSLHQHPCYPGTGDSSGVTGSHQNILNLPLNAGGTIEEYQQIFEARVIPFFEAWQADLLIVSAGYDANRADPLAGMALQPEDYGWLTKCVLKITDFPLLGLEGGYDLDALARSVVATLRVCL